ncbi:hypothetical protein [Mesorhizobium sp. L103C131B0]|uniref:hypothetical protein n=1 Tax=Mesorhizobium sp. L103C131B0 TaxID=1287089 RepID=UPI0003FEDF0B|nr:hypothetical protein [Mesorhizobium sp. L103C131B0]
MSQFLTPPLFQAFDASANPRVGAKAYIYGTGTTALLSLFSNELLTTPQANPMIADAAGVFPNCFIAETKFKVVLKTSADVIVATRDPVYSTGQADNVSASNVSFDGSGIGFSSTNVQDALVEMYGSVAKLSGADFLGPVTVSQNSTGAFFQAVSTDDGAAAAPSFEAYRNSASPAAADVLGEVPFYGKDSTDAKTLYAAIRAVLIDPVNATEDGELLIRTVLAGTLADRLHIRGGAYMEGASGGDKGAGTFNATGVFENGVRIGAADAVLEDQKASGTDAQLLAAGAFRTRDLNTKVRDVFSLITLSTNQFTPSVSGWVEWSTPAKGSELFQSRLFNVTDTAAVGYSSSGYSNAGGEEHTTSCFGGAPVVAGKTYRIEQRNGGGNGGIATSYGTEVYTRVQFWRTA